LNRIGAALLLVAVALGGCGRQGDGDLREAYDRMMVQAERRAAREAAEAVPQEEEPVALRPDTLPAAVADPPEAAPADEPVPPPPPGAESSPAPAIPPVTQRDIRVGQHANFDRVVFEFDGATLPGYHVEYVDRPIRECGTGDTLPVAGDGWLRVRFQPARAHEFFGETARGTVGDRNRTVQMGVVRQLTVTCDFEAQVEWVVGVASPNRYEIREMEDPARLVIDVLHD
jgi:hypothetical protein